MIACPKCNANTTVNDTRRMAGYTRRRRVCVRVTCNHRFTTMEMMMTRAMTGGIVDPVVISRRSIQKITKVLAECFTGRTGSAAVIELFQSLVPEALTPTAENESHGETQPEAVDEDQDHEDIDHDELEAPAVAS